jgi:VanZ family protein
VRSTVKRLLLWGPVVLQMILIFGASSMSDPGPLPGNISDKSGHFIGYALLAILLLRALAQGQIAGVTLRTALLAIVFSSLYGVTDEIHQALVPGRTPDVLDALADALGSTAGVAVGVVIRAGAGLLGRSPVHRE